MDTNEAYQGIGTSRLEVASRMEAIPIRLEAIRFLKASFKFPIHLTASLRSPPAPRLQTRL